MRKSNNISDFDTFSSFKTSKRGGTCITSINSYTVPYSWHSVEGAFVHASARIVPLLEIYEKFHVQKQNKEGNK